jgi:hypothetical protein
MTTIVVRFQDGQGNYHKKRFENVDYDKTKADYDAWRKTVKNISVVDFKVYSDDE